MSESELLMAFYGDDFTGSTDAMESLTLSGIRTILFTAPPTREEIERIPGLQAFGVAGQTRAMPPAEMRDELTGAFAKIKDTRTPIIHYKVCSTFDSSPAIGSIGCAMEVGADVYGTTCIPIVGGAPHLGRYCAFGNLFAKGSGESSPIRLDRHPNMMNHPVTPMTEADLRLHLGRQTKMPIELFDITRLSDPTRYLRLIESQRGAVLMDFVSAPDATLIGMHLLRHAQKESPLFVIGSSGVEVALAASWKRGERATLPPVASKGPILVAAGSCSPVTARQIRWAQANGFISLRVDAGYDEGVSKEAVSRLRAGESVILHTGGATDGPSDDPALKRQLGSRLVQEVTDTLASEATKRLLIAGGDTSGEIAEALHIDSIEMIGELVRGAPLCVVSSQWPVIEGLEVVFKGGQIGGDDFFGLVRDGVLSGATS